MDDQWPDGDPGLAGISTQRLLDEIARRQKFAEERAAEEEERSWAVMGRRALNRWVEEENQG